MTTRKIEIKIPQINWKVFWSFQTLLVLLGALLFGALFYWYFEIRPYFWVTGAHVETFSTLLSSDHAGKIAVLGPAEGQAVNKGEILWTLDADLVFARRMQTKRTVENLAKQVEFEREKMGQAMEDYLIQTNAQTGLNSPEFVQTQLALMEEAQEKAEQAAAQLGLAKSELASLDLEVEKKSVAAPFDAIVLKRMKELGSVVGLREPVYVLSDPKQLWIEAEIPETHLGKITMGTGVKIQIPAYPERKFLGRVSWIGPATVAKSALLPFSYETQKIPIKISLESPHPSLKPGLSARVALKIH